MHTQQKGIQIDQFFATEVLELLTRCNNDLPEDIVKYLIEFEKSGKMNPPSEKKTNQILTEDLAERYAVINAEAGIHNVFIPLNFEEVKNLE